MGSKSAPPAAATIIGTDNGWKPIVTPTAAPSVKATKRRATRSTATADGPTILSDRLG